MQPIVVGYDQHCRFCRWWKRQFERWERQPGRVTWKHYADVPVCGLKGGGCGEALEVRTADGRVLQGFYAVRHLLHYTRFRWLSPLFYLPGAAAVGERVYGWVAARRYRLGGRIE